MFTMSCQGKCFNTALYSALMVIVVLQLLSTLERQVFDFLGFMWAPIIANFIQIVCCIIGGFGTYQYRAKFIAVYSTWSLMWLGWNIFVICLYLEVGVLSRSRDLYILNIGTKNKSWWLEHGIGCKITNTSWQEEIVAMESSRPIPPEDIVQGCLLDYYYVEVIHAGVQCLLALCGFIFSCVNIYMYSEEDESCKYLAQTSTYNRPPGITPELPSPIHHQGYQPLAIRDSWCLPSYVSYDGNLEWSNSVQYGQTTQTVPLLSVEDKDIVSVTMSSDV